MYHQFCLSFDWRAAKFIETGLTYCLYAVEPCVGIQPSQFHVSYIGAVPWMYSYRVYGSLSRYESRFCVYHSVDGIGIVCMEVKHAF